MATDPIENPYGPTQGPFSHILQSGLVPGTQQNNERPSGYMGAGGQLAYMGTKLLEGIQRGKVLSYMASEAKKDAFFKAGLAQIDSQLSSPDLTPEQRGKLETVRGQWFAQHLEPELQPEKKSKGKKSAQKQGGSTGQGESPADQIKGVLGSIVGKLGGPDLPKSGTNNGEWLQAQLNSIGAPSLQDNIRNYQGNLSTFIETYKQDHPDATIEDIQKNKIYRDNIVKLQQSLGQNADKAMMYVAPLLSGIPSKQEKYTEQKEDIGLKSAKIGLEGAELDL